MTKVFVMGISDFVGSNLAINLVKEGYSVDGLVTQVSSRELASLEPVLEIRKFKRKTVFGSYPPRYPLRPAQWPKIFKGIDSTKKRKLLGWKPTLTLNEGLEKINRHVERTVA